MNKPHRPSHPPHLPDWKLERFLLGELPPPEMRSIQADLDARPDLADRAQALREERAALLAAHPVAGMSARIERRLRRQEAAGSVRPGASAILPRPRAGTWVPALGMLLVLALLPFTPFSPFRDAGPGSPSAETTRLKGLEPRLLLHRKTEGGSQKLLNGETARSGDLIQVHYESAGRTQGALLSLDAAGKVTRHLPARGNRSVALRAGGPVPLDFAYELDDAPGWERFYLITSDRPFDLGAVEEAMKRRFRDGAGTGADGELALPGGLEQSLFILLKESGT